MAIYHFSAKMISRSTGRSAVAAAAYRTAERIEDHRQGLEHDYSNRTGVLSSEILVPEGTPDSMKDRATLWNAVEAAERRKDAQLAREVTVALPHELDDAQRGELVRSFVQTAFVDRGMIADVALHAPGKEGEALRGADFTALKETNDYVREQEREAERSAEKERDIGIDRERGHSL